MTTPEAGAHSIMMLSLDNKVHWPMWGLPGQILHRIDLFHHMGKRSRTMKPSLKNSSCVEGVSNSSFSPNLPGYLGEPPTSTGAYLSLWQLLTLSRHRCTLAAAL